MKIRRKKNLANDVRSGPLRSLILASAVAVSFAANISMAQDATNEVKETVSDSSANPRDLAKNLDDRRPDDQFQVSLFGHPVTIGGEYEANPENRVNFNLQDANEDLFRLDQEVELEVLYEYDANLAVYGEAKLTHRYDDRENGRDQSDLSIERGQAWVYYRFLPEYGLAIQAGRQNLKEKRSWWWDQDLDAVRLHWEVPSVHFEIGIGEEIERVELDEVFPSDTQDVRRIFSRLKWTWAEDHRIELFWLSQQDDSSIFAEDQLVEVKNEDASDADLTWLGVRAAGRYKQRPYGYLYYWADLAKVSGDEDLTDFDDDPSGFSIVDTVENFDVDGWGIDIGATWRLFGDEQYSVTVGYARGSGDSDATDSRDKSFRQTGLNQNKGKFRGVDRFRYYGELFRPELSNMRILTLGVGRRFLQSSSVDLVYHTYQQVTLTPGLRSSRIDSQPNGISKNLGSEIDLVVAIEEWRHWELSVALSVFRAGAAFAPSTDKTAYRFDAGLKYNF